MTTSWVEKDVLFFKCDDSWVLATDGITPTGVHIEIEPVRIIGDADAETLAAALGEALSRESEPVPEPDYRALGRGASVYSKALGLRTDADFAKRARCFNLSVDSGGLEVSEWSPGPRGSFLANPTRWTRRFPIDDLDGLVAFLSRETAGVPPHQQRRRLPRRG